MTYPVSFRRHILAIRDKEGLTLEDTSQRFGVGRASLTRWLSRLELDQSKPRKRKIDLAALHRDVQDYPDAYQYERAARFGVATNAIWQALQKIGVTYKKVLAHPKADPVKRRIFQARIKAYQAQGRTIVYLDESNFASDMPRTYGYATKGQRCYGLQDWNAKGRINVIGALLVGGLLTVGLTDSNVDADIFNLWLEQDLIPKLAAHSVIVMDNATFHKRADTKHMIKNVGHRLAYLPPYSPDLNSIEQSCFQTISGSNQIYNDPRCDTSNMWQHLVSRMHFQWMLQIRLWYYHPQYNHSLYTSLMN